MPLDLPDSPLSSALEVDWVHDLYPQLSAIPRWATPRDVSRPTMGTEIGAFSSAFRAPFMPWQQLVADVGGELDENGRPWYRQVIVTVHRQAGKTTLILSWESHRCLVWKVRQRVVYAAQSRHDAREKLLMEQVPILQDSPLGSAGRAYSDNGHERWQWANGSHIGLMSVTKKAGHGPTNHLVVVDEAFAQTDFRLDQSLLPTTSRVKDAQTLMMSTAGDESSVYLIEKVRRGRHMVESGKRSRIAYFEWSIPLTEDIDDPAVMKQFMPGYGPGAITLETLREMRASMTDADYRRAFANQWTSGMRTIVKVIPAEDWEAMSDPTSTMAKKARRRMSIDVAPDQSEATIGVAGTRADGVEHLEAFDTRPGTSWAVERAAKMAAKRPQYEDLVAIDTSTPAAALIPGLERAGLTIVPIRGADWNAACASFFDAAMGHTFRHLGDPVLTTAMESAVKKPSADGWHWARRGGSITPLCAVTLAHWALVGAEGPDDYDPLDSFF